MELSYVISLQENIGGTRLSLAGFPARSAGPAYFTRRDTGIDVEDDGSSAC